MHVYVELMHNTLIMHFGTWTRTNYSYISDPDNTTTVATYVLPSWLE